MLLLLNSLLIFLLISCDVQDKPQTINFEYKHNQRHSERTVDFIRHNVKVEPNIADEDLDSNMSVRILVPLDLPMYVNYKNFKKDHPDTYYEYGTSDTFIITTHSPDSLTVNIPVSVNPNYPVQEIETIDNETTECTENCIVDNSTIVDNVTFSDNATWSDNFTRGVTTTQTQKTNWRNFWDNLSISDNWSYISVGHIDNVTHFCDNSSIVTQIITQIQNDNITNWNASCNQMNWITGGCGAGLSIELSVKQSGTGDCGCNRTNDNTTTIRPAITNRNWGGIGITCGASSQSLEVILKR